MPAESRNIRALLARRSGGIHRLDALQSQARKLYHHTTGDNFANISGRRRFGNLLHGIFLKFYQPIEPQQNGSRYALRSQRYPNHRIEREAGRTAGRLLLASA